MQPFGLTSGSGPFIGWPLLGTPLSETSSGGGGISTTGLVAHYKFDTLTLDSSPNGNTLTNFGGVTQAAGLIGEAASLDGADDQVLYASPFTFNFNDSSFTIAMWVNLSDNTHLSGLFGNAVTLGYYNYPSAGDIAFSLQTPPTALTTSVALNNDEWYFLIFQFDAVNNLMGFSVNGGSFVTQAATNTGLDGEIAIGGDANDPNHDLAGLMDEVSIWSRLLTPSEIAWLYNGGAGNTF
jgi:hypothetical protein